MPAILDSRNRRHRLRWTWPDMLRLGLVLWLVPVAILVVLDSRMLRMLIDGDRRAAALQARLGKPVPAPGRFAIPGMFVAHSFIVGFGLFCHYRLGSRLLQESRHLAGRCRVCGYDLSGLAPGPDELLTCPECGGAWTAPSITPT